MVEDVENIIILNRPISQDMPGCLLRRILPCEQLNLKTRFVCGFMSVTWADKIRCPFLRFQFGQFLLHA